MRAVSPHVMQQSKCERTVCGALAEDERKNCVAKCLSPACFDEHLGNDPLEDGQVDDMRQTRFNACAAFKFRVKDAGWNGDANVSPEERRLPDSQWRPKSQPS